MRRLLFAFASFTALLSGCAVQQDDGSDGQTVEPTNEEQIDTESSALTQTQVRTTTGHYDLEFVGDWLYWTEGADVKKIKKDGSGYQVLCAGCGKPSVLTVDGTHVFFLDIASLSAQRIRRVPVSGGAAVDLATTSSTIIGTGLSKDMYNVYWATSGSIQRVSKNGGAVTTVVSGIAPVSIAVDNWDVFWTGNNKVMRQSKSSGTITQIAGTGLGTNLFVHAGRNMIFWNEGSSQIRGCTRYATGCIRFSNIETNTSSTSMTADYDYIYYTQWPFSSGYPKIKRVRIANPTYGATTLYTLPMFTSPDDIQMGLNEFVWADSRGLWKSTKQ